MQEREELMQVRELMTKEVTTLQETDTMLDAAMIFARSTLRHLPVLRGKQLVGILTERDLKRFAPGLRSGVTAEEYNKVLETTVLSRVMTKDPTTLTPDQEVAKAADLLYSKRIGCLPIVENGELVGIITTTDMLRLMARMMK